MAEMALKNLHEARRFANQLAREVYPDETLEAALIDLDFAISGIDGWIEGTYDEEAGHE